MDDDIRRDRLTKNEVLIREQNAAAGETIKKYFRGDKEVLQAPIAFICECSRLDCDQHVNISIDTYEKLHEARDRFMIYPGHETASVEKTIANQDGFDIVEKFTLRS
jgi:hypothetical protein